MLCSPTMPTTSSSVSTRSRINVSPMSRPRSTSSLEIMTPFSKPAKAFAPDHRGLQESARLYAPQDYVIEGRVIQFARIEHGVPEGLGGNDTLARTPALPHAAVDHAVPITGFVVVLEAQVSGIEFDKARDVVLDEPGRQAAQQRGKERDQGNDEPHQQKAALRKPEITQSYEHGATLIDTASLYKPGALPESNAPRCATERAPVTNSRVESARV